MGHRITYSFQVMFVTALLLISSCTERIDIELDSTYQRLVVEGVLTSDSVRHYVLLSVTSDYFSNQPATPLSHTVVEISFEGQTMQLIENDEISGRYETSTAFRGNPGTTYILDISQIDINQDGVGELYHAESTMPGGSELETIELRYYTTPVVSGYGVFLYAYNPVDQRDWYGFKLIRNGDVLTDSLSKYRVLSDELFDTGYFPGLPVGFLSDDDPREKVQSGDTLTLQMDCIEEVYYNFVTEAQLELAGRNPLISGPPANVVSNVDNGAQGIFAAHSILRYSIIAE
ncbi:MAG: DUF4249 family protein [Bacteroidales bacterium]|nr:DUF4249 family protein [Bacteroidales bacterium]